MKGFLIQVFFSKEAPDWPDFTNADFMGLKIWKPDEYSWAVDYLVCGDQRWCMFGPYETKEEAMSAIVDNYYFTEEPSNFYGFRIMPTHCYKNIINAVPRRGLYTDG